MNDPSVSYSSLLDLLAFLLAYTRLCKPDKDRVVMLYVSIIATYFIINTENKT